MKIIDFKCPGCGAQLEVDVDQKQATCSFCNKSFPVDDEAQHFKIDGAAQAGYEFEKGRQQAQVEFAAQQPQTVYVSVQPSEPPKKRKTWLWVLGWIFIFPVPLTILMLKNENLDKKIRYAIIVIGWLAYFGLAWYGSMNQETKSPDTSSSNAAVTAVQSSSSALASESATSTSTVSTSTIELTAGQKGEYGQGVTMSKGTDQEEKFFAYYVPEGTYNVKNLGDKPTQVSVYEGFKKSDNGYDEYTSAGDAIMLKVDETGTINVPNGWFIEIHEPTHIALTAK